MHFGALHTNFGEVLLQDNFCWTEGAQLSQNEGQFGMINWAKSKIVCDYYNIYHFKIFRRNFLDKLNKF